MKMIKQKYHHRLINSFNTSLEELFKRVEWKDLDPSIQGNIHRVYEIATQYDKGEHEAEFNQFTKTIGK